MHPILELVARPIVPLFARPVGVALAIAASTALALAAAACTAGGSASPGPSTSSATSTSPGANPSPGASLSAVPVSPAPGGTVHSPDEAAALVLAQNPAFANITPKNPDLIGQSAWYDVTPLEGGWQVVVQIGWGDCPSGCIDNHKWTWAVSPDGQVGLIAEEGPAVPSDVLGEL